MIKKELIERLAEFDDNEEVWFYHELKGRILPAEIVVPINKIEHTVDGILLH